MTELKVEPANENLLVEIIKLEKIKEGIYNNEVNPSDNMTMPIDTYTGRVLKAGPNSYKTDQAPGVEVGDLVMFSQFAGVVCPTKNIYSKVIPGHMIVVHSKDEKMEIENLKPVQDRLLVEVIMDSAVDDDGIVNDNRTDPRENATSKGIVVSVADGVKGGYKKGDVIHFDPYCGTVINNDNHKLFKAVSEHHILFTIK